MGKNARFNSSLQEKKDLLARLKISGESTHPDIDTAIRICEDALLLHEMHFVVKTLYDDAQVNLKNVLKLNPTYVERVIDNFYSKVERQKHIKKLRKKTKVT